MIRVVKLLEKILDIIFPPLCFACERIIQEKSTLGICENCFNELEMNFHFFCPICKSRLPSFKNTCHKETPHFILGTPFDFNDNKIKAIIHNLKYQGAKRSAFALGFFIVEYLLKTLAPDEMKKFSKIILLPVPLHKRKERKRGFNQALLIAQGIKFWKEKLDLRAVIPPLEIKNKIVVKIKNTPSQTEQKSEKERKENVKGTFAIKENLKVSSREIIAIVDDVYTSGATVKEIIKLLRKQNRHSKIIALTAAKT